MLRPKYLKQNWLYKFMPNIIKVVPADEFISNFDYHHTFREIIFGPILLPKNSNQIELNKNGSKYIILRIYRLNFQLIFSFR